MEAIPDSYGATAGLRFRRRFRPVRMETTTRATPSSPLWGSALDLRGGHAEKKFLYLIRSTECVKALACSR